MVDAELFPVRRPSVDRFTAMCSLMRSLPVRKHLQATAEPSDHHNSVVDIDEILLESGPPFVTGGCGYIERGPCSFHSENRASIWPNLFLVNDDGPTLKCLIICKAACRILQTSNIPRSNQRLQAPSVRLDGCPRCTPFYKSATSVINPTMPLRNISSLVGTGSAEVQRRNAKDVHIDNYSDTTGQATKIVCWPFPSDRQQ